MRRKIWLLAAVVFFAAAAWLMSVGEKESPQTSRTDQVSFPRQLRRHEQQRMATRRVATEVSASASDVAPPAVHDPMLSALPRGVGKSAVVIEANAIRHSPIGELLLECLRSERSGDVFQELRENAGIDVLKDLDRVAVSEGAVLFSGQFGGIRWDEIEREARTQSSKHGQHGRIMKIDIGSPADGGQVPQPLVMGIWKDQLLMAGVSEEAIRKSMDQAEGRGSNEPPILREEQTYGEIYGVLSPADLSKMLPAGESALAQRIQSAAERIELHVDASQDVGMVAEVMGSQTNQVEDLGKSLGAALALGRLKAKTDGEDELAEFLELAKVRQNANGRFNLEMAVPLALLEKHLAFCRESKALNTSSPAAPK